MPPAKAGAKQDDSTLDAKALADLKVACKRIEELSATVKEYEALKETLKLLQDEEKQWIRENFPLGRQIFRTGETGRRMTQVEKRIKELESEAQAAMAQIEVERQKVKRAVEILRKRAAKAKGTLRTARTVNEVQRDEELYACAHLAGDQTAQDTIQDLFDAYKAVASDLREELGTHEYRKLVRKREGLGLKERGEGICFKMLDQYQMMSPKERAQFGGIPNVIGCTEEGVRQWMAKNAEFAAEAARKAYEEAQEVERARPELQDLRLTCYPMPDWVRERIDAHPQKAVSLQLGARAPLPVPFTRDEVLQSVRDVARYGSRKLAGETAGRCTAVDPTSVAIAKYVAGVLAKWFNSWGWVRVQLVEGGGWMEFHLADRIDKLHNDPFTYGFSPRREPYVVPLELGPSFATTFDTESRLASAPSYLRIFGRPVFGPAAALAQELEAAGELTPEGIARVEELMRSGATWDQVRSRTVPYGTGESWVPERGTAVRRP